MMNRGVLQDEPVAPITSPLPGNHDTAWEFSIEDHFHLQGTKGNNGDIRILHSERSLPFQIDPVNLGDVIRLEAMARSGLGGYGP